MMGVDRIGYRTTHATLTTKGHWPESSIRSRVRIHTYATEVHIRRQLTEISASPQTHRISTVEASRDKRARARVRARESSNALSRHDLRSADVLRRILLIVKN